METDEGRDSSISPKERHSNMQWHLVENFNICTNNIQVRR